MQGRELNQTGRRSWQLGRRPSSPSMTPEQCRAARELLDWNRQRLGVRAGLSSQTVYAFESRRRTVLPRTIDALRMTLELAGIEFVAEGGDGPGVRLRTQHAQDAGALPPSAHSPRPG
ncbi:helix-turn-helix transcriptional regulator [Roseomonas sp. SSH11]|uniref:Helix-turn-helix transcriptional regulator n=1 Tax=Pararoseomonas baculiformis TaxID=2820812 RepID=A0ABS4AHH1_9PROT|nr:helix-turn-helix transcriptional regulator [Pararoseomonas baculiformis]MBP0446474.1 helix-turn-helix transcriptional regulator [Pararoseomonas baculiformis]